MTALAAVPTLPILALFALSTLACMFAVPSLEHAQSRERDDEPQDCDDIWLQELMVG